MGLPSVGTLEEDMTNCTECRDKTHCLKTLDCVRQQKCINTHFQENVRDLSGIIHVDKEFWYCHRSYSMLQTAGIIEWFLLSAEYQDNLYDLNNTLSIIRQCPLLL